MDAVRAFPTELDQYKEREKALLAEISAHKASNLQLHAKLHQERADRIRAEQQIGNVVSGAHDETATAVDSTLSQVEEMSPEAIWDFHDDVFRCPAPECLWEVVDNECQRCNKSCFCDFEYNDCHVDSDSVLGSQAMSTDRHGAPRGTTPLLEVPPVAQVSPEYADPAEYHALLQRGATPLMCEVFNLRYTAENGIYASADPELYAEFSGPAMADGDHWKIHLGRRIELDDTDVDGSVFIESLLEDAILFPVPHEFEAAPDGSELKWITAQEEAGVWVTRLTPIRTDGTQVSDSPTNGTSDDDFVDQDGPVILWDSYEEPCIITEKNSTPDVVPSNDIQMDVDGNTVDVDDFIDTRSDISSGSEEEGEEGEDVEMNTESDCDSDPEEAPSASRDKAARGGQ